MAARVNHHVQKSKHAFKLTDHLRSWASLVSLSLLAPAVRRVPKWVDEQRHVVVLVRALDDERDLDARVEELAHAVRLKVLLRVEDHAEGAGEELRALGHQGRRHAAVRVGVAAAHDVPLAVRVERLQLDLHVGRGAAARRVEYVGRDGGLVRHG